MRRLCPSCGEDRLNILGDCANIGCKSRQREFWQEKSEQTRAERDWNGLADRADLDRTEPFPSGVR